jgi:glycosyltransferase involved in cell wall biosynthesis
MLHRLMRKGKSLIARIVRYSRDPRKHLKNYLSRQPYAPLLRQLVFRPSKYRAAYADLGHLTRRQARRHYYANGRYEGRFAYLRRPDFFEGGVKGNGQKPFIFLVIHEASRTGAPILALSLLKRLNQSYRVISVLKRGGELAENFRANSAGLIVFPEYGHAPADLTGPLGPFVAQYKPRFAITNSAEVSGYVSALELLGVPCVFLVHEFAENTADKKTLDEAFSLASHVVFPAEVVAKSNARGSKHLANRNYVVRHQGLPPVPAKLGRRSPKYPISPKGNKVNGPTVIGLGSVIPRKGVDLFIQIASYVVNDLGMTDVFFNWIGHPGDPVYRDELLDYVRKAGLEKNFEFSDAVDNLDSTYALASALVVSSRYDPFPNVAIESLVSSTPVISFAGATGISDWLLEKDYSKGLVVPYLDTYAAAHALRDLLTEPKSAASLGRKLGQRAKKAFVLSDYVDDLVALGERAASLTEARAQATSTILDSNLFDFELFTGSKIPEAQKERVVARYVQLEHVHPLRPESPYFLRRAVPGLNVYQFEELNPSLSSRPGYCALASFIETGQPAGDWYQKPIVIDGRQPRATESAEKALIHIHVHYADLFNDFLKRLKSCSFQFDLFVTTSSKGSIPYIRRQLNSRGFAGRIKLTPNVGRDLVPFMDHALPEALEKGYEFIAHLHTKKSVWLNQDMGATWREFLWTTLIGNSFTPSANEIIREMISERSLGLVFATDALYCGWDENRELATRLAEKLGLGANFTEHFDFPVGTMFWARPEALRSLARFEVSIPPEPLPSDGTELHALERLIPAVVKGAGFSVRTVRVPGVQR